MNVINAAVPASRFCSWALGVRSPAARRVETAEFTADVLGRLAAERYSPGAWWRFWARSWSVSAGDARAWPQAARETHLLHALLFAASHDPRVGISWVMTWTHLGLLSHRDHLGVPNTLSILRAHLPLFVWRHTHGAAALATVAMATDAADGLIARRWQRTTAFGGYADSLTDAVFWVWFAHRFEPSRWLRGLAFAFWGAPPIILTILAFARGRMLTPPRPRAVQTLSAVLQAYLTVRAWRRGATLRADHLSG